MNTLSGTPDDPIAELHEIRRRIAAQHGNDPRRHGEYLRQRQQQNSAKTVRVRKALYESAE